MALKDDAYLKFLYREVLRSIPTLVDTCRILFHRRVILQTFDWPLPIYLPGWREALCLLHEDGA